MGYNCQSLFFNSEGLVDVKLLKLLLGLILLGTVLVVGGVAVLHYTTIKPTLPDVSSLKTIQLQTPMRV